MDEAKLREAVDYGTANSGFAVRVYRDGCLVAEDRLSPRAASLQFESWSLAKSVTALVFGRAMTQGLVHADDRVGGLIPEADAMHGQITLEQLLTMTSGLQWNGLRDYNIFMRDRLRDALTGRLASRRAPTTSTPRAARRCWPSPCSAPSGRTSRPTRSASSSARSASPQAAGSGSATRSATRRASSALNMRADDFGRFGDLMRRGGRWKGRQVLSESFIDQAVTPSRTNGCYGWLIWLNRSKPCVGPRVSGRPVSGSRDFPTLPPDLYRFSGLFGQVVSVFPSQDIVVVRTGQESTPAFSGGSSWEKGLYERVLGSVTDQRIPRPADANDPDPETPDADRGFQTAVFNPGEYFPGIVQPPLPPAAPRRARAMQLFLLRPRATAAGLVRVRLTCPARWPGGPARRCRAGRSLRARPRDATTTSLRADPWPPASVSPAAGGGPCAGAARSPSSSTPTTPTPSAGPPPTTSSA